MNEFGLGLILNFTDNASAGMQRASQSFEMMSRDADGMMSSVNGSMGTMANMGIIGSTLMHFGTVMQDTGSSILGVFERVGKKISGVGMDMYVARAQLTSLYEGADEGEVQLNKIMTYARKSVFAFKDVLKATIMMKANGIEALDELTSSSGKSSQKLMDYASDLAAFNPQMRNSYGSGVKAAMGAINEYIAEGNAISLKRGASVDINAVLGEGKADSLEGRKVQIADMMEKLHMVGLTAGLAKTPMQQLCNMGDLFFQTLAKISSSGVFDRFSKILATITVPIQTLADTTDIFDRVAVSIADAINILLDPIQKMAEGVAKWIEPILEFVAQHPRILAMISVVGALVGVSLTLGGVLFKLLGSIVMLKYGMILLSSAGITAGSIFKMVMTSIGSLVASVLPFVIVAFVLYKAWKSNILGIRDVMTVFLKDVTFFAQAMSQAFSTDELDIDIFEKAKTMGILPLIEAVLNLKHNVMDFIDGFKQGLQDIKNYVIRVTNTMTPFGFTLKEIGDKLRPIFDKFTGFKFSSSWQNAGNTFAKIATALVIALPLIKLATFAFGIMSSPITLIAGGIFLLFKNFDKLKDILGKIPKLFENLNLKSLGGYISAAILGLLTVFGGGGKFAPGFARVLLGMFKGGIGLIGSLGGIVGPLLGKFFPALFQGVVGLLPVGAQLFTGLFVGIFQKMLPLWGSRIMSLGGKLLMPIMKIFGSLGGKLLPLLMKVGGPIMSVLTSLFGPIISAIGGVPLLIGAAIIAAIAVVVALISGHGDGIKKAFGKIWGAIPEPIQKMITKVVGILGGLANKMIDALGLRPLMNTIQKNLPQIIGWFKMVGDKIIAIFSRLIGWVVKAWNGWLGNLIRNIGKFVGNMITIISGILAVVIPIVLDIVNGILNVVLPIVDGIGSMINDVMTVINGILDFIIGVFTGDWERAWNGIVSIFSGIFHGVVDIFKTIINVVIGLVNTFIGALNKIKIPGTDLGVNIPTIPSLSTGGYVEKEGVAMLHPSEVVVNAPMTKKLDEFLATQKRPVVNNNVNNNQIARQTPSNDSHDNNSVSFEKGSIIIQAQSGMTEAEMRSLAENIMKYAERKREIDAMARKPRKEALA